MLDVDFLRLCLIASLVYGGDVYAACKVSQQFDATLHVNTTNLTRILKQGFEINERTNSWLVGARRMPVSEFVSEIAHTCCVNPDVRWGWRAPVLVRRIYL